MISGATLIFVNPPSDTFDDRNLRTSEHPYGVKSVPHHLKHKVRYDTHLALLACEVMTEADRCGIHACDHRSHDAVDLPEQVKLQQQLGKIDAEGTVYLATAAGEALGREGPRKVSEDAGAPNDNHIQTSVKARVEDQMRLRGAPKGDEKATEELEAIGGVRCPRRSLMKLPHHTPAGAGVRRVIEGMLYEDPVLVERCMAAIGKLSRNALAPTSKEILQLRRRLCKAWGFDYDSTRQRVFNGELPNTKLEYVIWESWRRASQDPDDEVPRWLIDSATSGIEVHPKSRGIFPPSREQEPEDRPPFIVLP